MTSAVAVPKGWRRVRFGDVVRQVKETTKGVEAASLTRIVGLDQLDSESLTLRRWDELSDRPDGTSFTRIFRAGQVLFGKRRAYQRKVAMPDFDGICSGDILVFESSSDELLPKFLAYVVQSEGFFRHALGTSAGSLSPRTKWQDLAKYEFGLPPRSVQTEVISVLDSSRSSVERSADLLAAAESLRNALIEEATWDRARGNWLVPPTSVRHLLLEPPRNGLSPQTGGASDGQLRSVSIAAVQHGRFVANAKTEKWCDPVEKAAPFRVRAGDAFVVRGNGNRNLVGRVGLAVTDPVPPCIYPDLLIRLRFDPAKVDPRVATAVWNSPRVHARLLDRAKSSNGIYKVNGQDVSSHLLPVPTLLEGDLLRNRLRAIECTMDAAEDLRQAAATLAGRLRESLLGGASDV